MDKVLLAQGGLRLAILLLLLPKAWDYRCELPHQDKSFDGGEMGKEKMSWIQYLKGLEYKFKSKLLTHRIP